MTPETYLFCLEDTRDQIVGALAEAAALGLERPDDGTRRLREIAAIRILARGNVSQREVARLALNRIKQTPQNPETK